MGTLAARSPAILIHSDPPYRKFHRLCPRGRVCDAHPGSGHAHGGPPYAGEDVYVCRKFFLSDGCGHDDHRHGDAYGYAPEPDGHGDVNVC